MLYNDRYFIDIKREGVVLDTPASLFSFTLHDSIFSFYPSGVINYQDTSGLFSEFMSFINGTQLSIEFGIKDNTILCPFVVTRNSLPDQVIQSNFGGLIEVPLVHEYFQKQTYRSATYKDAISAIIRNKANLYTFKSINIDPTITKGTWYQPFVNDAEFMNSYLLPYAYSNSSDYTPFYLFIDSNNNFYFKTYKSLFNDQAPVIELKLNSEAQVSSLGKDAIIHINTSQIPVSELREIYHRVLYSYDSSGAFSMSEDKINSYPSQRKGKIPIKVDLQNITNSMELLSNDIRDDNLKNKNLGKTLFTARKTFHIEKLILTTNLNPDLRSGKKVNISVLAGDRDGTNDKSQRFSGEYLIESSYHKWSGNTGATVLVVSRQTVNVSNTYRVKSEVIS